MSKIEFDKTGERYYETGVSDCALYVQGAKGVYGTGVAWNGISSISESPEGAEVSSVYADNIKYLNLMSAEDFKATIEAYTYPDEFAICDGSASLENVPGLKITQQTRKKFGIVYKSKIGNDVDAELGYKLHIVYNCLAAPSERQYQTVNDSPEAMTMSWSISTEPINTGEANLKPTAHLEIDSTKTTPDIMQKLIDKLYGTEDTEPTLLLPNEVIALMKQAA